MNYAVYVCHKYSLTQYVYTTDQYFAPIFAHTHTKKYFQTNDCNKDEIYAAHLVILGKVIRIFLQQIGSSYKTNINMSGEKKGP